MRASGTAHCPSGSFFCSREMKWSCNSSVWTESGHILSSAIMDGTISKEMYHSTRMSTMQARTSNVTETLPSLTNDTEICKIYSISIVPAYAILGLTKYSD